MAVLNAWQKIDRVLPGQPFGTGVDGDYSSATIPTIVYKTCAGTATQTKFAADTDATPFAVGDVIMLHQTRGTGVGQWEVVKVVSLGSDEYNTTTALQYSYTDSGASQAQAVKVPQYKDVNVESGTWTVPVWDQNVGGILPIACNGTLTVTGTISGIGAGYRKTTNNAYAGEGTDGDVAEKDQQNGSGGGGGWNYTGDLHKHGGGGGGNGTAGENGGYADGATSSGLGGTTSGAADLTNITFGGAGGAGVSDIETGSGGGGGIVMLFAKNLTGAGTIALTATAPAAGGANGGHGGGAGGSLLIVGSTITMTSATISALGTGGSDAVGANGGDGGTGRIAVHHSGTITGTTNPTFTDVTDTSLVESGGGAFFAFF